MVESQIMDRNIDALSVAFIVPLRAEPNITDAETREVARNFAEFIRILQAMDTEQKAKAI